MNLKNLPQILTGWTNLTLEQFNLLNKDIQEEGERRLRICDACPLRVGNTCSTQKKGEVVKDFFYIPLGERRVQGEIKEGCGCNLSAKGVCPKCQCPLNKWYKDENI